jgi:hypothetical protein
MTHNFKKFNKSAVAEMNKAITGRETLSNEYGKVPEKYSAKKDKYYK